MSKTIDQIASDCDLHGADIETLRDILEDKTAVMQEQSPTKDGFCDIIEALYRRIEKLEEERATLERNFAQAGGLC
jgi:hypothetical protein